MNPAQPLASQNNQQKRTRKSLEGPMTQKENSQRWMKVKGTTGMQVVGGISEIAPLYCIRLTRCKASKLSGKRKSRLRLQDLLYMQGGLPPADEPPGSVRSEFVDLSIYHPIPSKRHHYNPHTLDNTTDFRSISHKHSDTVLKP